MVSRSDALYLSQNRLDHVVEDHGLVCCLRENAVESIRLVAEGVRAHRQLDMLSHDAIGVDDDSAVLLNLALIATPAPHDDIDVRFLVECRVEIAFLALDACCR